MTTADRRPNPVVARPFHVALAALSVGLLLSPARPTWALVASIGFAAAVALTGRGRAPALAALAAALVLAGAAVGDVRLRSIDAPLSRVRDGDVHGLRVQLVSPPRPNPFGSSAEVRVVAGRLRGTRLLMRIARWTRMPEAAQVGSELAVDGHVRPPASHRSSSGFDFAAQLRRQGVAGELLLDDARPTGRRGGVAGALDAMRRHAERAVAAGLPPREAALARGMVLGQDERIGESTRQDWRDSGLSHLLAVSGQNVMLLVALGLPLLALTRVGPTGRGVALVALIGLYVPLAGAGPSLQRAGVTGVAGIIAVSLSRPASRWYALLLAAAATLVLNPRVSGDPGWQLSFAAVAGILLIGRPLAATLARMGEELIPRPAASAPRTGPRDPVRAPDTPPGRVTAVPSFGTAARVVVRALAEAVAITVSATLATAPLVAYHFGSVPVAGLLANLLAVPAVAPAMWLGMVKAALGIAGGLLPPADSLAELLGPVARVPLDYLERLAERFAYVPGGRLALPIRSPTGLAAAYAAEAVAVAAVANRRRLRAVIAGRAAAPAGRAGSGSGFAERAAAWRRAPRSLRAAVGLVVLGALLLATAAGLGSPAPPGDLTVRFLDVGQGDATLIQDGRGANVLFDAGPPEAPVYRELRAAGVERLDLAVSTHQSRDHQGGFHGLIDRMPIGLLVENGYGTRDPDYHRLLAEANARGIRHIAARAGELFRVGRLTVEVLGPPAREPGSPPPDDPNPIGVAAIVSEDGFDLWLSADAESDAILSYPLRPVEAMKVSHHGSADPGLPEVLDRLRPRIAAIEVGAHNTYGHPTPSTLAALRNADVPTYRTDQDGTVTLTVTHDHMQVTTAH